MRNTALMPALDSWDWQQRGSCRGMDPAVFYHPDGERGRARTARERRAKEICHECPVLPQCRHFALTNGEVHGIWGGMSEDERYNTWRRARGRAASAARAGSGELSDPGTGMVRSPSKEQ